MCQWAFLCCCSVCVCVCVYVCVCVRARVCVCVCVQQLGNSTNQTDTGLTLDESARLCVVISSASFLFSHVSQVAHQSFWIKSLRIDAASSPPLLFYLFPPQNLLLFPSFNLFRTSCSCCRCTGVAVAYLDAVLSRLRAAALNEWAVLQWVLRVSNAHATKAFKCKWEEEQPCLVQPWVVSWKDPFKYRIIQYGIYAE